MDRLLLSLSVLWRVLFSSQVMPRPSGSVAEASEAEVVVPASVALAARRSGPVAIARPGMGGVYRPGMIYRPGFRGSGWRAPYYGRGWRYPYNGGYSPRYPYYGWGARRGTDTRGPELSVLRLWRLSDA
jgi:hypothetical protein